MIARPAALLLACAGLVHAAAAATVRVDREAYLMGTRATLAADAPTRAAGLAMLETALEALEETEAELSTWRETSAISLLNHTPPGVPWPASPRLCAMFSTLHEWQRDTRGAFDPAIGALLTAWRVHERGRVPSDREIARARARSGLHLFHFDGRRCTLQRSGGVALDVGGFGKGEGLDRVAAAIGAGPWMIDLGGQVTVGGPQPDGSPWMVGIAHPRHRDRVFFHVQLAGGSLATSGGSERDQRVNGVRIGHILDPRSGRPAPFDGSVTVWHERGLAADILSTALYVMGPDEGLRWAEARGLSACFLVPQGASVRVAETAAFRRLRLRR